MVDFQLKQSVELGEKIMHNKIGVYTTEILINFKVLANLNVTIEILIIIYKFINI